MRPSPWLRLTALLGAAGTLLAVVSGSAGLGTAHRVLAALALPPLAAVVASRRGSRIDGCSIRRSLR